MWLLRTAVAGSMSGVGGTAVWGAFLQQGVLSLIVLWGRRMLWQAGGLLLLGLAFLSYGFLASRQK